MAETPAIRLYRVLTDAMKQRTNETNTCIKIWARVAAANGSRNARDRDELALGVVKLYREVGELIEASDIGEHAKTLYRSQLAPLLSVCSLESMGTGWGINDASIQFLILLDEQLRTSFPESIDNIYENIDDVVSDLENLIDDVKKIKLNKTLKKFTLDCLEVLLFHLRNASVFGPAGIRDSYVKILVEFNSVDLKNSKPEDRKAVNTILEKIKEFNSVSKILRLANSNVHAGIEFLSGLSDKTGG